MNGTLPGLVYDLGWVFLTYGFLGVVVEVIYCLFVQRPGILESRSGVLYLPFNPLYGVAGAAGTVLLVPVAANPVAVFLVGAVSFTAVEYASSVLLERGLHVVAWDYSREAYNLHGRICLRFALYWGALSLVLVYVTAPVVATVVEAIPRPGGDLLLLLLLLLTAVDTGVTVLALVRVSLHSPVRLRGPAPESSRPSGPGWSLIARLAPDRVLIDTFPHVALVRDYAATRGLVPRRMRLWRDRCGIGRRV